MARTSRDQVIQLYKEVLGRDPYPTELARGGWVDRHSRSGQSVDQLRQTFQNSDEARSRGTSITSQPAPTAPAPVDPTAAINNLITEWYAMKPATPGTFTYSAEQKASDTRNVEEQYRPFFQEQSTQSGEDYKRALSNARQGFSRRGLWGAAAGTEKTTDAKTGIENTVAGTAPTGGPRSGLREVGEQYVNTSNTRANTAIGRAYTEGVAGGVQGRQADSYDTWSKTIRQPYEDQFKEWRTRLSALEASKK